MNPAPPDSVGRIGDGPFRSAVTCFLNQTNWYNHPEEIFQSHTVEGSLSFADRDMLFTMRAYFERTGGTWTKTELNSEIK